MERSANKQDLLLPLRVERNDNVDLREEEEADDFKVGDAEAVENTEEVDTDGE